MPLTPNNREEHWLQGMVDGQTTLEPNKRSEYWYKEIINAIGSGGGGGGGGGGASMFIHIDDQTGALDKTWKEMYDAFTAGTAIILTGFRDGFYDYTLISAFGTDNASVYGIQASNNIWFATDSENGYPVETV